MMACRNKGCVVVMVIVVIVMIVMLIVMMVVIVMMMVIMVMIVVVMVMAVILMVVMVVLVATISVLERRCPVVMRADEWLLHRDSHEKVCSKRTVPCPLLCGERGHVSCVSGRAHAMCVWTSTCDVCVGKHVSCVSGQARVMCVWTGIWSCNHPRAHIHACTRSGKRIIFDAVDHHVKNDCSKRQVRGHNAHLSTHLHTHTHTPSPPQAEPVHCSLGCGRVFLGWSCVVTTTITTTITITVTTPTHPQVATTELCRCSASDSLTKRTPVCFARFTR